MQSIMKTLNDISRCQATYRATHAVEELAPCHHTFVLAICRAPGRSQEELARDICLNKSTVARTLAVLEERGYIERRKSESDRRELLVYPTARMLAVLPRVREIASVWQSSITADLCEGEVACLSELLSRVEARARALAEGEEAEE